MHVHTALYFTASNSLTLPGFAALLKNLSLQQTTASIYDTPLKSLNRGKWHAILVAPASFVPKQPSSHKITPGNDRSKPNTSC
eukprot:scaffold82710_cov21-Tisochrysis_lutea.AAC.3